MFAQVEGWLEHEVIARELADECYRMAKRCFEDGDIKNGQKARFEVVAEKAQKALAEMAKRVTVHPFCTPKGVKKDGWKFHGLYDDNLPAEEDGQSGCHFRCFVVDGCFDDVVLIVATSI